MNNDSRYAVLTHWNSYTVYILCVFTCNSFCFRMEDTLAEEGTAHMISYSNNKVGGCDILLEIVSDRKKDRLVCSISKLFL